MSEQFNSQMNFLQTYMDAYEKRICSIKELEKELDAIQAHLDRAADIKESIEDLKKQNRADEKFLISMNDMVQRNMDRPISSGPLFDEKDTNNQEQAA